MEPTTATLKNGTAITIRPLRTDDRERMAKAIRGLDPQSIYTRFFSHRKELTEAGLDRIMHTSHDEVVLIATTGMGEQERVIGSGRYIVTSSTPAAVSAEIAFAVEEDFHGLGIAGRLLNELAAVARNRGVQVFEADILAENPSMLRVFERSGLPLRKRSEGGIVHLELTLAAESSGAAK